MANVTTRHIRTGWAEWIDWPEDVVKSATTMCGRRTRSGLTGIPGITKQDRIVEQKNGKRVWGWCPMCVRSVWRALLPDILDVSYTSPCIIKLQAAMREEIEEEYRTIVKRRN